MAFGFVRAFSLWTMKPAGASESDTGDDAASILPPLRSAQLHGEAGAFDAGAAWRAGLHDILGRLAVSTGSAEGAASDAGGNAFAPRAESEAFFLQAQEIFGAAPEDATLGARAAQSNGLLVQFAHDATAAQRASALSAIGGTIASIVRAAAADFGELALVDIGAGPIDAALAALNAAQGVSYAEANWTLAAQAVSNDTYYTNGSLWGMYGDQTSIKNVYGSQAGEAWASGYIGSSKIVVGDVDSGIDYTHPDLYLNVWLNQGELPKGMALKDANGDGLITFVDLNAAANASFVSDINKNGRIDAGDLLKDSRWADGVDGDGNGYVDDLIGWDFANNDNDPYDDNGHGTHTAGTIGASGGNGTGVAGVSWNTEILPLKFLSASGSGSLAAAVKALNYYTSMAIEDQQKGWSSEFIATNNSWGGGGVDKTLQDAISYAAKNDILFVAAAGNSASNNDVVANYPSNYTTKSAVGYDSVIAVAALTSAGGLASFSNYGATSVDLAAPGQGIWSTVPGGYASYSGTSMATPYVTGALSLLAALHPEYTASQLRDALLGSTAATSSLAGKVATGGRLDVGALMSATPPAPAPAPAPQPVANLTLYGTTKNDTLTGKDGNDILCGVPATGSDLGRGTIDTLIGGAGNDRFILGDARGRFYDDGDNTRSGLADCAIISDFQHGDVIQLYRGTYYLSNLSANGVTGSGIFADSNRNGRFDTSDELIGLVKGVAPTALTSSDFVWA